MNPLKQSVSLSFTEDGEVVDVATRLASLGLVLLECKHHTKIVPSQPNKSHLPLVLEEISRTLQHKKLDVEPALLEEITREHQEISEILKEDKDSPRANQLQKDLTQKVLGIAMVQILETRYKVSKLD